MQKFIYLLLNLNFMLKSKLYEMHFNKLGLINKSRNLVNSAILEIKENSEKRKIKAKIAAILIDGIKRSLKSGEITLKLNKSNNVKIVVWHSLIEETDKKIYHFSDANIGLKVDLRQVSNNRWMATLTVIGFIILGFLFYPYQKLNPVSQVSQIKSNSVNFPMSSCGDLTSGGINIWHPVYVAYSESDLDKIQNKFCCDAVYSSQANAIQVASFYDKKRASDFAQMFISKGFSTARVGYGSLTNMEQPSSARNQCHESGRAISRTIK